MNVLILGGGGFIGRHTASALLAAGHKVSALQRSDSAALPAGARRLQGDRGDTLPALAGTPWDACVDLCGYFPRALRASCAALSGLRRYVFVSAVRVYGDPAAGPVTEDFPLLAPAPDDLFAIDDVEAIDDATYGPLKAACEGVVQAAFGDRATLLRPQVVAGPGDPSGRVAHWQGQTSGPFPGGGSDWLQMVDVRDIADFVATVIEGDLSGTFNLSGPRIRWREFVEALDLGQPRWAPVPSPDLRNTPLYRPAGTEFRLPTPAGTRHSARCSTPDGSALTVGRGASRLTNSGRLSNARRLGVSLLDASQRAQARRQSMTAHAALLSPHTTFTV